MGAALTCWANSNEKISSSRSPNATLRRNGIGHEKLRTPAYGPAANDKHSTDETKQPVSEAGAAPPTFSPLELLVIRIGERDPLTLVAGILARLLQLLFGIEAPRPFADRRLEALRSLTIALRRRRSPHKVLEAAIAAGVNPDQIEHLRSREQQRYWNSQ